MANDKPTLFWDFHGTLTHPDINWFDAAIDVAAELVPEHPIPAEVLTKHFGGTCLPWFSVPSRDTRHIAGSAAWWAHCQAEFEKMFMRCGLSPQQATLLAPALRPKILQPHRYRLYPDAADTLAALGQRGYQSHILSNNFPELELVVEGLGLRRHFGQVLVSGLIGYEKPRPEIFAHARQFAAAGPAPWMIGDNPIDDIEGARAAGFVTVAVHGVDAPAATHSLPSLAALLEILP